MTLTAKPASTDPLTSHGRVPRTRPDADLWPDLAAPPSGPRTVVSARIARAIFTQAVGRLPVSVHVVGRQGLLGLGGPGMVIHRPDEFFARVGRDGLIGFGEAYLSGAWEADDLGAFLTVLAARLPELVPSWMQRLRATYVARPPRAHRNTEDNTRGNIAHHYDLSNDLFATFLDPTLSYSSALFDSTVDHRGDHRVAGLPRPTADGQAFAEAQGRKIERLLDHAGVTAGTRLLEIGTGWGELAIRAAARGAIVRSVTLSTEQQALARARVTEAGWADRVEVDLCDYRAVSGTYDAVVSVEMIEAVGHEYWRTYFQTLDRLLAPGGRVAIQAITMPHDRMLATRNTWTWINKYIFPGGFLPSVEAIEEVTREATGLVVTDRLAFGLHYAETLARWDRAFLASAHRVRQLGFDDTFIRMWHFYLEYSRGGFASGYLDVQQVILARPDHAR